MFDVRKFRPRPRLLLLFLSLSALTILGVAQDKATDKEEGKEKESKKVAAAGGPNFVKVAGKSRCDKPDPAHTIEVPDRPGHALIISKRKCVWTESMVILGAKTKDGVAVGFSEKMEGTLHDHGFEVDTMDNGEKITWQTMGQVFGDKGPATDKGRWSLMRGTGKFKGIKGGGTYEGKLEADDSLTLEFEGVYDLSDMAGEKK